MIKDFINALLGILFLLTIFACSIILVEKNHLITSMQDCIEHADYLMQCDSLFDKDTSDYMSDYKEIRDSIYKVMINQYNYIPKSNEDN